MMVSFWRIPPRKAVFYTDPDSSTKPWPNNLNLDFAMFDIKVPAWSSQDSQICPQERDNYPRPRSELEGRVFIQELSYEV